MTPEQRADKRWSRERRATLWIAVAMVVMLTAFAMRAAPEFNWTLSDFFLAAVLLGAAGVGIAFTTRSGASRTYRGAMLVAIVLVVLTVWVNGAVGIVGGEDNPLNVLFWVPIIIGGLVGARARFAARTMKWVTAVTALWQLGIGAMAATHGYLIWTAAAALATAWTVSAMLFKRAERSGARND